MQITRDEIEFQPCPSIIWAVYRPDRRINVGVKRKGLTDDEAYTQAIADLTREAKRMGAIQ